MPFHFSSVLKMWQLSSLFSTLSKLLGRFCFICASLLFVWYLFEVNMCDIWAWHSVNRQAIIGTGLSAVCLMPCLL